MFQVLWELVSRHIFRYSDTLQEVEGGKTIRWSAGECGAHVLSLVRLGWSDLMRSEQDLGFTNDLTTHIASAVSGLVGLQNEEKAIEVIVRGVRPFRDNRN